MSELDRFKGNILTREEKKYRMDRLRKTIADDDFDMAIDRPMVPYLKKINTFPFIVTTQSCCADKKDQHAHIDFRSMLSERETINHLLKPLAKKFEKLTVELSMECDRLRYIIWLDNETWEKQLKYFITLLRKERKASITIKVDREFFYRMREYENNESKFSLVGFTMPIAQKVMAIARLSCWDAYHIFRFAREIPSKGTYLEIGSFIGGSLLCAWKATKESKRKVNFIAIEPFTAKFPKVKGPLEQKFDEITKAIPVNLLKTSSDKAKDLVPDNSVDLIFIDGGHSYAQVKKDIENYWLKLKEGGVILGHDYKDENRGVVKAVNKVFGKGKTKLLKKSSVWMVEKLVVK